MVRAIRAGKKTQTRRVLKHQVIVLPYSVGDILWVRETFRHISNDKHQSPISERVVEYRADSDERNDQFQQRWKPSMFMPRSASRITLEITEVRVQKLQDITSSDAIAEGCSAHENSSTIDCDTQNPRDDFRNLWNSLNQKRGFGWDINPWVAALSFRVI
jgi:hypothetical protein